MRLLTTQKLIILIKNLFRTPGNVILIDKIFFLKNKNIKQ